MSAETVIGATLWIAKQDLDGADLLHAARNRNADYLLEQAAEKIIRAVLTSEGKLAGWKHKLGEMVDQLPDENPLKVRLAEIAELEPYATTFRYATSSGRVPRELPEVEFVAFSKNVRSVLEEAAKRFGVDLTKERPAAKLVAPIR